VKRGPVLIVAMAFAMVIHAVNPGLSSALFFIGLRHLGASRTATFFLVGPYAAALAAILFWRIGDGPAGGGGIVDGGGDAAPDQRETPRRSVSILRGRWNAEP